MISNELKICKGFGKQDPYSLYFFSLINELFLLLMIYVLMILLQL